MAILGNKKPKELTELDKLKAIIVKHPNLNLENKEFLKKCDPEIYNFGGEKNFIDLIMTLINNRKISSEKFSELLEDIQKIYSTFEVSGYGFSNFLKLFVPNGIYENKAFSMQLVGIFEYIENYFIAMNMIIDNKIALQNFEETVRLISSLRIYAPNDTDFISLLAHFLTNSNFADNYQELVDKEISLAKMRAGVYEDLSDEFLAKVDVAVNKSQTVFDATKKEEQRIKGMSDSLRLLRIDVEKEETTLADAIKRANDQMGQYAEGCIDKLERQYIDVCAKLKNDLFELKRQLVEIADTEAKKVALVAVNDIEKTAKDIAGIKDKYDVDIATIEQIKKSTTEEVHKGLEEIKDLVKRLGVDENVDLSKLSELLKVDTPSNIVVPSQTIVTPVQSGIVVPDASNDIKIPDILPCFNETIAFKERFKEIMDRKAKFESEGEVFNAVIDDCIYLGMKDFYIYLYGPSGGGKNYFVKQLAKLFGLPLVGIGYITEEYDIVGGKTAHGTYSPSNFYNCWRYGYFAFANEFDTSIAQPAIKLGEYLDCEVGEKYSFPSIGMIERHPNFRLIAAGNTTGMGSNRVYNARQKFDESLQQRFVYVKFDFDERVEKEILKDYMDWYNFAILFREALSHFWNSQEADIQGQITTRDFRDIVTMLDDGILNTEKILQYEFIETKDLDCLSHIKEHMIKCDDKLDKGTKILTKQFIKMVDEKEGK